MHETGVVSRAAAELAAQLATAEVGEVTVAIGPGMEPEVTRHAWLHAVAGGPLENAALELVHALDVLRCLDCGDRYDGAVPDPCPRCGGHGLVVDQAEELSIVGWRPAAESG